MGKIALWTLSCLSASILLAAGKYQPLNVKLGTWETVATTTVSGAPPIPQEMLDKMTAEQRARFEAAMSKMASGTPKTRTSKSCLTKEKLEKDPFNDKKSCTETVLTSTGSKMEIQEVCSEENAKLVSKVRIEATDSENAKGWVDSTVTGSGKTMNITGTFTSKWVGAACSEKP
ncbi:MAG TPA: DUF3617 family protein [Terriglobia bacterium]|nr:DUF3617 family protein [Terriglobia bacterium]